jgi:heme exporter protein D
MNYDNLHDLWELGGYGRYVWPAYGLTALLMIAEPWLAARRLARALSRAKQQTDEED